MRVFTIVIVFFFILPTLAQGQRGNGRPSGWTPPETSIKGKIIDAESEEGLEFATISIFRKKDGSVAGGGLSEANGVFDFKVKGRRLYAVVEYISYESVTIDPIEMQKGEPVIDLGEIQLSSASIKLEDVEIIAEKSETTFSLDKKVFTVGKDLANRGGSAEDVLNNVPSLDVDIEGTVTLRGSEGVRILIDGRPSSLVGVNSGSGLRSLPSNLIEKIEVITNPSARYDAEGMAGIVNIVMKKNKSKGFNGSIDVSGGYPANGGISTNLNYRKGPLNWFVNYGINYRSNRGLGHNIQDRITAGDSSADLYRQITTLDRDPFRSGLSNSIRFGADYFLTDKTQLTAAFRYKVSDEENDTELTYKDYSEEYAAIGIEPLWTNQSTEYLDFDSFDSTLNSESLYGESTRIDNELEDESALQYSLNLSKEYSSREHKLNASISYQDRGETEKNTFAEKFSHLKGGENFTLDQRVENDEISKTWEFQLDYVKPLGTDHKWEAGVRSSLRDIETNYLVEEANEQGEYEALPGLDNSLDYDEDVIAAYGLYGNRNNNISYQAGLRGEYSILNTKLLTNEGNPDNKREFFNFFPSAHVSYHINDTDALQLSYSRRISRPRFRDLNPFFTFQDRRNFFSGNPNLNPQYTDSYEIGQIKYWEGLSVSSSLFYRRTKDSRQRFLILDNTTSYTVTVPVNVGVTDDYGLDLSLGYSAKKWLRINFNTNIFRNQLSFQENDVITEVFRFYSEVRDFEGNQEAFRERYGFNIQETDNITWNAKMTTKFSFLDSDLQVRLNYRGPRESLQGQRQGIASVDLGWSKDFLASKNLTATISVRDLFNSRKRAGQTYLDDFYQQSEFQWRSRMSTLTLSYRINQKKQRKGRPSGGNGGDSEGEF